MMAILKEYSIAVFFAGHICNVPIANIPFYVTL